MLRLSGLGRAAFCLVAGASAILLLVDYLTRTSLGDNGWRITDGIELMAIGTLVCLAIVNGGKVLIDNVNKESE